MRSLGIAVMIFSLFVIITGILLIFGVGRDTPPQLNTPADNSVNQVITDVKTQDSGMTVEQENISKRLSYDNQVGSVQHLYILSAYSGEIILYSTVKGKVTSSGKRLQPYTVCSTVGNSSSHLGYAGMIDGRSYYSEEVMQEDGTFGHSSPYIYWWDVKGIKHQHFITDGQIIHISDVPMQFGRVTLNIENG